MRSSCGEYDCSDLASFCVGVISDYDPVKGLVKVSFDADTDDDDDENPGVFVTDWIPFLVRKSQDCKETFPFDIGEQVVCMMDDNWEEGVVLGATYNDIDAPDGGGKDIYRIKYKDGSYEQFDRSAGNKTLFYNGDFKMTNNAGADFETEGAKFKMLNASQSLGALLKMMCDKIIASNYTNGAGVTGPPNNAADFTTLKTLIDQLFA